MGDPRGPTMNRHPSLTAEPGLEPRSLGSKSSSLFFFLRGKKKITEGEGVPVRLSDSLEVVWPPHSFLFSTTGANIRGLDDRLL